LSPIPNIDGNASVGQWSHNIEVPFFRRNVQWTPTIIISVVDICTVFDKEAYWPGACQCVLAVTTLDALVLSVLNRAVILLFQV
jgi:hypothetical protein